MIKVCIVHNVLWSHYKGVVFSEFAKICADQNIELLLLQIALTSKERKVLGDLDISVHNYPYKLLFKCAYDEISLCNKLRKILIELIYFNPDVIVIPGWNDPAYWVVELFARAYRKKIVLQCDSTRFDKPRVWYKEFVKKFLVKLANAYWCYGSASKEYLKKLSADEVKIFVRLQATDNAFIESEFRRYKNKKFDIISQNNWKYKNFIYVGRLSFEKNVILLLKAFCRVKQIEPKAEKWGLIIVGDGPLRKEIEVFIFEHSLKDIYLVGGKSWREVPRYYALADVFVLPSISEPWGLVINEAMVCGLPVIVSKRAGAYFDLVKEGINGFGFDPYNEDELINIMLKFVRNEVDLKSMGKASKKIIGKYTPENAAKSMFMSIKFLAKIN